MIDWTDPRSQDAELLKQADKALYSVVGKVELLPRYKRFSGVWLQREATRSLRLDGNEARLSDALGGTAPEVRELATSYVRPPPEGVLDNQPVGRPPLLRVAYACGTRLDAGRPEGRRLMAQLLASEVGLRYPVVGLSGYFTSQFDDYRRLVDWIQGHGDVEDWPRFFLVGVIKACKELRWTLRTMAHLAGDDPAPDYGAAPFIEHLEL